ncbi:MAG: glycerate kinase type-2 family protein [Balneola sp.]
MKETYKDHQQLLKKIIGRLKSSSDFSNYESHAIKIDRAWILGAGKSSVSMARKLMEQEEISIKDGIIISNYSSFCENNIQVFKGSHPFPDEDSVSASYELLQLARKIPAGETVIFCLSGGASSMLCIPPDGVEIDELAEVYKLLLNSGASIHEINVVRKHLCLIKGGQLAQMLHHVNLITLIESDVPDNDLETIGGAPTICDSSTFKDAFQVLKRYRLWDKVPHSVRIQIAKGMSRDIPETPKPGINDHPNHTIKLISEASSLADIIAEMITKEGYNSWVAESSYNEDVRKVSKMICSKAISVLSNNDPIEKPAALIFYGESTVEVKGDGKGGRNQELALISAISIEGQHSISMLSIGTDGIDGPTDAAGAIIDSKTTLLARKKKISPEEYLQKNDSYNFHNQMGTLIKTGPIGKNLMDLQVLLIE